MINTKRIYEAPDRKDGFRILVDRLWPRGVSRSKAKIDLWFKEIAPSDALRKWSGHDRDKCAEFKKKYFMELKLKQDALDQIVSHEKRGAVTLVYAAKDEQCNNAAALKEYLEKNE